MIRIRSAVLSLAWVLFVTTLALPCRNVRAQADIHQTIATSQPKLVKINGSGGYRGLESYQSGFIVSEDGYIVTAWSYVLDSTTTVTLNDGNQYQSELIGYDPRVEIALLKIDAKGLEFFNLDSAVQPQIGSRVLAFCNLYGVATGDEQVSVLHGVVSAKTKLAARKGAHKSTYQGDVYILDAMTNNPGAAGGAVTDQAGQLIGFIGKEVRDSRNNMWLNFAIPISRIASSVEAIRTGKEFASEREQRLPSEPMTLNLIGIGLVPDVVARTPPYLDRIFSGTAAEQAGLRPDDLIVEVNGQIVASQNELDRILKTCDRDVAIQLTIQRDSEFVTVTLRPK